MSDEHQTRPMDHSARADRCGGCHRSGHRSAAAAWRRVCTERDERCVVPVVVREVTDERMLTIGAQENLQRADLTPLEEAQIVAWHEKTFYPASQAVIGGML